MKNEKSNLDTTKAFEAFKRGDHTLAKELYEKLASRMSTAAFKKNIELCNQGIHRNRGVGTDKPNTSPLQSIRIACILDEFSYASFSPECETIQLKCGSHIQQLERFKPDLFFVESAWSGINNSWDSQVAHNSENLRETIKWCKARDIPTSFWNKEDPVHFETFINTAKEFDFIFTTDIDCVPKYKGALGHERAYFLPFSCQPSQLGPTEKYDRKAAFSFAGAYYTRYPERARDLEGFVNCLPRLQPLDIFDRNHGKDDPKYMFPDIYQPFIRGSLPYTEIDKAYKGYTHSINLNSVKQSQSMFARRAFDLAASNTSIISNYSRGLRLIFGDLTISTDDPQSAALDFNSKKDASGKLRLLALRKVLSEHTSKSRIEYVLSKSLSKKLSAKQPRVLVISSLKSESDLEAAILNFSQQTYPESFFFGIDNSDNQQLCGPYSSRGINNFTIARRVHSEPEISSLLEGYDWIAIMSASDYWGRNYLVDQLLATHYTRTSIIGKNQVFIADKDATISILDGHQYSEQQPIKASTGIFKVDIFQPYEISQFADHPDLSLGIGYSIDCYNYCLHGRKYIGDKKLAETVDDMAVNCGLSLDRLRQLIDNAPPSKRERPLDNSIWTAEDLYSFFGTTKNSSIDIAFNKDTSRLEVSSSLEDKKHDYLYSSKNIAISELYSQGIINGFLDCDPGLNIMIGFRFLDENLEVITTELMQAGKNSSADIPSNTAWIKPCLRILGGGHTSIHLFSFSHYDSTPAIIIGKSKTLLITNRYPSYDNLYQNAFVHTRLKEYKRKDCEVEVFQLQDGAPLEFREFEDIDIISGDINALRSLLESRQHESVLIHFLSDVIWNEVGKLKDIKKIVWIHGIDIQLSHRRSFLYDSSKLLEEARSKDFAKKALWSDVFAKANTTHLVFVSEYLAKQTMEDYGISDRDVNFSVINNPINDNIFVSQEKPLDQRKAILSIRPYNSIVYANDLAVAAVIHLSKEPFFDDLKFLFVGDGHLFDETTAPLRNFSNVNIMKTFLRSAEILNLHRQYGIFLAPSRMDTQGVSRDEAMASGLVPVTTRIAAIPEFVNEQCGILAEPEDYVGLAEGIRSIYYSPDRFSAMSSNAASIVRRRSCIDKVIKDEISLFKT